MTLDNLPDAQDACAYICRNRTGLAEVGSDQVDAYRRQHQTLIECCLSIDHISPLGLTRSRAGPPRARHHFLSSNRGLTLATTPSACSPVNLHPRPWSRD